MKNLFPLLLCCLLTGCSSGTKTSFSTCDELIAYCEEKRSYDDLKVGWGDGESGSTWSEMKARGETAQIGDIPAGFAESKSDYTVDKATLYTNLEMRIDVVWQNVTVAGHPVKITFSAFPGDRFKSDQPNIFKAVDCDYQGSRSPTAAELLVDHYSGPNAPATMAPEGSTLGEGNTTVMTDEYDPDMDDTALGITLMKAADRGELDEPDQQLFIQRRTIRVNFMDVNSDHIIDGVVTYSLAHCIGCAEVQRVNFCQGLPSGRYSRVAVPVDLAEGETLRLDAGNQGRVTGPNGRRRLELRLAGGTWELVTLNDAGEPINSVSEANGQAQPESVNDEQAVGTQRIWGRVTTDLNEPISSVVVRLVGTQYQTQTGNDGRYVMYIPVGENQELNAAKPGYTTMTWWTHKVRSEMNPQLSPLDSTGVPVRYRTSTRSVRPEPEGGYGAYYRYLSSAPKMPDEATRQKISGQVQIDFQVNPDGSLSDFRVVQGLGAGCDEEAIRVIQEGPKWSPGKANGEPVAKKVSMPVPFGR